MKVIAILGSRNPKGRTAQAVEALIEGLRAGGAETETVFLPELKIERCRQCDDEGWGLCIRKGECVIKDDFPKVVESMRACDGAVFGTPVYFGDLSESMRAFLDRLRRICLHESGKDNVRGKTAIGVCVAGGGGGGAPSCSVSLESELSTSGFDVVDMVPVRRQNLDVKKKILSELGRWYAGNPKSD